MVPAFRKVWTLEAQAFQSSLSLLDLKSSELFVGHPLFTFVGKLFRMTKLCIIAAALLTISAVQISGDVESSKIILINIVDLL